MGDRANVRWRTEGPEIFFYTHWSGSDLEAIIANALIRGKERWNDGQYLARIVFCEMVMEDVLGKTGYGISTIVGDGDGRYVTIDTQKQTATGFDGKERSFAEFAAFFTVLDSSPLEENET